MKKEKKLKPSKVKAKVFTKEERKSIIGGTETTPGTANGHNNGFGFSAEKISLQT